MPAAVLNAASLAQLGSFDNPRYIYISSLAGPVYRLDP
jgi:hypothetical protein